METLETLKPSPAAKVCGNWKAETWIHVAPGHALRVSTAKDWSYSFIHTCVSQMEEMNVSGLWQRKFNGYSAELETTQGQRATEKTINAIHARLVTREMLAAHVDAVARTLKGVTP